MLFNLKEKFVFRSSSLVALVLIFLLFFNSNQFAVHSETKPSEEHQTQEEEVIDDVVKEEKEHVESESEAIVEDEVETEPIPETATEEAVDEPKDDKEVTEEISEDVEDEDVPEEPAEQVEQPTQDAVEDSKEERSTTETQEISIQEPPVKRAYATTRPGAEEDSIVINDDSFALAVRQYGSSDNLFNFTAEINDPVFNSMLTGSPLAQVLDLSFRTFHRLAVGGVCPTLEGGKPTVTDTSWSSAPNKTDPIATGGPEYNLNISEKDGFVVGAKYCIVVVVEYTEVPLGATGREGELSHSYYTKAEFVIPPIGNDIEIQGDTVAVENGELIFDTELNVEFGNFSVNSYVTRKLGADCPAVLELGETDLLDTISSVWQLGTTRAIDSLHYSSAVIPTSSSGEHLSLVPGISYCIAFVVTIEQNTDILSQVFIANIPEHTTGRVETPVEIHQNSFITNDLTQISFDVDGSESFLENLRANGATTDVPKLEAFALLKEDGVSCTSFVNPKGVVNDDWISGTVGLVEGVKYRGTFVNAPDGFVPGNTYCVGVKAVYTQDVPSDDSGTTQVEYPIFASAQYTIPDFEPPAFIDPNSWHLSLPTKYDFVIGERNTFLDSLPSDSILVHKKFKVFYADQVDNVCPAFTVLNGEVTSEWVVGNVNQQDGKIIGSVSKQGAITNSHSHFRDGHTYCFGVFVEFVTHSPNRKNNTSYFAFSTEHDVVDGRRSDSILNIEDDSLIRISDTEYDIFFTAPDGISSEDIGGDTSYSKKLLIEDGPIRLYYQEADGAECSFVHRDNVRHEWVETGRYVSVGDGRYRAMFVNSDGFEEGKRYCFAVTRTFNSILTLYTGRNALGEILYYDKTLSALATDPDLNIINKDSFRRIHNDKYEFEFRTPEGADSFYTIIVGAKPIEGCQPVYLQGTGVISGIYWALVNQTVSSINHRHTAFITPSLSPTPSPTREYCVGVAVRKADRSVLTDVVSYTLPDEYLFQLDEDSWFSLGDVEQGVVLELDQNLRNTNPGLSESVEVFFQEKVFTLCPSFGLPVSQESGEEVYLRNGWVQTSVSTINTDDRLYQVIIPGELSASRAYCVGVKASYGDSISKTEVKEYSVNPDTFIQLIRVEEDSLFRTTLKDYSFDIHLTDDFGRFSLQTLKTYVALRDGATCPRYEGDNRGPTGSTGDFMEWIEGSTYMIDDNRYLGIVGRENSFIVGSTYCIRAEAVATVNGVEKTFSHVLERTIPNGEYRGRLFDLGDSTIERIDDSTYTFTVYADDILKDPEYSFYGFEGVTYRDEEVLTVYRDVRSRCLRIPSVSDVTLNGWKQGDLRLVGSGLYVGKITNNEQLFNSDRTFCLVVKLAHTFLIGNVIHTREYFDYAILNPSELVPVELPPSEFTARSLSQDVDELTFSSNSAEIDLLANKNASVQLVGDWAYGYRDVIEHSTIKNRDLIKVVKRDIEYDFGILNPYKLASLVASACIYGVGNLNRETYVGFIGRPAGATNTKATIPFSTEPYSSYDNFNVYLKSFHITNANPCTNHVASSVKNFAIVATTPPVITIATPISYDYNDFEDGSVITQGSGRNTTINLPDNPNANAICVWRKRGIYEVYLGQFHADSNKISVNFSEMQSAVSQLPPTQYVLYFRNAADISLDNCPGVRVPAVKKITINEIANTGALPLLKDITTKLFVKNLSDGLYTNNAALITSDEGQIKTLVFNDFTVNTTPPVIKNAEIATVERGFPLLLEFHSDSPATFDRIASDCTLPNQNEISIQKGLNTVQFAPVLTVGSREYLCKFRLIDNDDNRTDVISIPFSIIDPFVIKTVALVDGEYIAYADFVGTGSIAAERRRNASYNFPATLHITAKNAEFCPKSLSSTSQTLRLKRTQVAITESGFSNDYVIDGNNLVIGSTTLCLYGRIDLNGTVYTAQSEFNPADTFGVGVSIYSLTSNGVPFDGKVYTKVGKTLTAALQLTGQAVPPEDVSIRFLENDASHEADSILHDSHANTYIATYVIKDTDTYANLGVSVYASIGPYSFVTKDFNAVIIDTVKPSVDSIQDLGTIDAISETGIFSIGDSFLGRLVFSEAVFSSDITVNGLSVHATPENSFNTSYNITTSITPVAAIGPIVAHATNISDIAGNVTPSDSITSNLWSINSAIPSIEFIEAVANDSLDGFTLVFHTGHAGTISLGGDCVIDESVVTEFTDFGIVRLPLALPRVSGTFACYATLRSSSGYSRVRNFNFVVLPAPTFSVQSVTSNGNEHNGIKYLNQEDFVDVTFQVDGFDRPATWTTDGIAVAITGADGAYRLSGLARQDVQQENLFRVRFSIPVQKSLLPEDPANLMFTIDEGTIRDGLNNQNETFNAPLSGLDLDLRYLRSGYAISELYNATENESGEIVVGSLINPFEGKSFKVGEIVYADILFNKKVLPLENVIINGKVATIITTVPSTVHKVAIKVDSETLNGPVVEYLPRIEDRSGAVLLYDAGDTRTAFRTFSVDTVIPTVTNLIVRTVSNDVIPITESGHYLLNQADGIYFNVVVEDAGDYRTPSPLEQNATTVTFTIDGVEESIELSNVESNSNGTFSHYGTYRVDDSTTNGVLSNVSVSYTDSAGNVGSLTKSITNIIVDTIPPEVVTISDPLKNGEEWVGPVHQFRTAEDGVYAGLRDTLNFQVAFNEKIRIPSVDCDCIFLNRRTFTQDPEGLLGTLQSVSEFGTNPETTSLNIDISPSYSSSTITDPAARLILRGIRDIAGNTLYYENAPNETKIVDPTPPRFVNVGFEGEQIFVDGSPVSRTELLPGDVVSVPTILLESLEHGSGLEYNYTPKIEIHYIEYTYRNGIRSPSPANEQVYTRPFFLQGGFGDIISTSQLTYSILFQVPNDFDTIGFVPNAIELVIPEGTFIDRVGNTNVRRLISSFVISPQE